MKEWRAALRITLKPAKYSILPIICGMLTLWKCTLLTVITCIYYVAIGTETRWIHGVYWNDGWTIDMLCYVN